MFGLIPMAITILLSGIVITAVAFLGGDAFTEGSAQAQARKVINQGEQISAAIDMYKLVNGSLPVDGGGFSDLTPIISDSRFYGGGDKGIWGFSLDGASTQVSGIDQCDAVNEEQGYTGPTPDCSSIPPQLAEKKFYCCSTP